MTNITSGSFKHIGRDTRNNWVTMMFVTKCRYNCFRKQSHIDTCTEAFHDQASISGRWYNKAKKREVPHSEIQAAIRDKGPLFMGNEGLKFWTRADYMLQNGDVPNAAAVWAEWEKINEKFYLFWRTTFGKYNEKWLPPVDVQELQRLV